MESPNPQLMFAVRGSKGIGLMSGITPPIKPLKTFEVAKGLSCRVMQFSNSGNHFAYCDGTKTYVIDSNTTEQVHEFDLPKTAAIHWSPKDSFVCTWETFAVYTGQTTGSPNLKIFNLETGELVAQFIHRFLRNWTPNWTDNEQLCSLMGQTSEVLFYADNVFEKPSYKLCLKNVSEFSLSPVNEPFYGACYVPSQKAMPAYIRIFLYPNLKDPVAHKSFFKADSVKFKWNKRGNAVLGLSSTEVDSTGASYYGEQSLYLVLTNGDSFRIELRKDGPIYSFAWSPSSAEFCVVYGYMPAKATLFNLKGDTTFDFGTGARNEIHYNPFGNILCLAGFGNLRGNMEFWHVRSGQKDGNKKFDVKRINQLLAEDTTLFRWAPDGEHFLTSTTAPRLRVNNGYKIWHYAGKVLTKFYTAENEEMYETNWRPFDCGRLTEQPIRTVIASGDIVGVQKRRDNNAVGGEENGGDTTEASNETVKSAGAYVPPHLRGKSGGASAAKMNHRIEELPQNEKEKLVEAASMSKTAKKNKKKRDAQKNKVENDVVGELKAAPMPPRARPGGPKSDPAVRNRSSIEEHWPRGLVVNAENEKQIRNIQKKMSQIDQLKLQKEEGKELEQNQLDKITREADLIKELQALRV